MCGICGVVQLGGAPRRVVAPGTLDRMTDAMVHRGPNDRGTHQEDGVALGVRRLSIVDVEGGHQPFANENGRIWAIQNGELYNHDSIRRDLQSAGHAFASRCDTEILPHLYEQHGASFPERLRGKFGIAVWDANARRLVLARDRLGVKPLYYAVCGDVLVFASELKSVLASGLVGPELDYDGLDAYLTLGFFPAPHTPLAGVRKLAPGCALVVEDGRIREQRYWTFPTATEPTGAEKQSLDEYAERLLAELEDAVRVRLMSDVPLGAMLSGGLDSSLIVALMARHSVEPVQTFSVGFGDDGDSNELERARAVAAHFGADHHELELSLDDAVDIDELVWALDEPVADLSSLGFHALSQLAAQTVTVALAGQGADELLGGYRKHRAAAVAARLPGAVRRAARVGSVANGSVGRAARMLAADDPVERLLAMSGSLDDGLRSRLVRGPLAERDGGQARLIMAGHVPDTARHALRDTLHLDAHLWLVDDMLHYFDRVSMAHSLEVRVPFLDHHVVEYCATIPSEYKVGNGKTKRVLRHAASGLVPDAVIAQRKVSFFHNAIPRWLGAQAGASLPDYLLTARPAYADFLERREVEKLVLGSPERAAARDTKLLLSILVLEVWLSTYLPRALKGVAAEPTPTALTA